jgi:hypothetical protein
MFEKNPIRREKPDPYLAHQRRKLERKAVMRALQRKAFLPD